MRKIQETRPLVESLSARIAKREGGSPRPLDTDATLHRQSLDAITELRAALKLNLENLQACQATIHLCGGFDPAYVNDAQAAMKIADAALAKYPALNPA
jgi:hypothetical protein